MIVKMVFSIQEVFGLFDSRSDFEPGLGRGELHTVWFYERTVCMDSALGANLAAT